ncbi:MAG: hypothetical protein GY803_08120 [Chloroflexi bacterium]|nr:hypothetical protein [Chloroflexota bacterium]
MPEQDEQKTICPFCNGTAVVSKSNRPGVGEASLPRYWVRCLTDSCADGPLRDTPEAALQIWQNVTSKEQS